MIEEINKHKFLKKAIHRSQHCQRNWDLSKTIPQEDLDLIIESATQCPSKQNRVFYKAHFITRRDIIENIHRLSKGFGHYLVSEDRDIVTAQTNPQVLANLLIVFESYIPESVPQHYVDEFKFDHEEGTIRDQQMAVGVAAGYVNMTATLLGYSTGCCACYRNKEVQDFLGLEGDPILMMGVGFKDENRNRREHHKNNFVFPTIKKHPIPVNVIN